MALLLAVLALTAASAPGQPRVVPPRIGPGSLPRGAAVVAASLVARRLAKEIQKVQRRFDRKKRELPAVQDPSGASVDAREQVLGLIEATEQDLDRAIERAGGEELGPMRAWAEEEFRSVRAGIDGSSTASSTASSTVTAAWLAAPRPVARYASLALPSPELAMEGGPAGEGGGSSLTEALARVGGILKKLYDLGENDAVQVKLWVGSTPEAGAMFQLTYEIKGKRTWLSPVRTSGEYPFYWGRYGYRVQLREAVIDCTVERGALCTRLDFVHDPNRNLCCWFAEGECGYVDDRQKCAAGGR